MTRITGHYIILKVAEHYGLSADDMRSQARYRRVARPRQVAMYAMRELCPHLSFPAIGRLLGNRDHTTILHGVRKVEALLPTNPDFARDVRNVMAMLRREPIPYVQALPFTMLCKSYGDAMRRAA